MNAEGGSTGRNPLLAYGDWVATAPRSWPAEAVASAHRQIIDLVAVMIPGAREPATRIAYQTAKEWGAGPCCVVGFNQRLAAPWAALVNGTAGHALDFDDNFDPARAHATAVLAPAIFALAEQESASGGHCIDAYISGLQIMGRVGQGVNPTHRDRGWHATATVGAVGAAAAGARLLQLDPRRAAHALSIATSMAGGFMSQFGTMTKPVHAGLAAKAGVMAASLARAGLEAGTSTLDGPTGMNRLMVGPDYGRLRDALAEPEHGQTLRFEIEQVGEPLLILEHGFRVKRFPNCGSAHRAMDALMALKAAHDFSAEEIRCLDVYAPKTHLDNLMHHDPKTGLEGKFSMQYALALCVHRGDCRLEDFTDAAVCRKALRTLYPSIRLHPVDRPEGVFPTTVTVTLKDGRQFSNIRAHPEGSKVIPFSQEACWRKYHSCVTGILDEEECADLRSALERFPELDTLEEITRHLGKRTVRGE